MAKSRKSENKADEPKGMIDALVDAPLRLFVFCVALLCVSLSTGMLIGTFVKNNPTPTNQAEIYTENLDQLVRDNAILVRESEISAALNADHAGKRPVDALNHNSIYQSSEIENEAKASSKTTSGEVTVAALPPSAELDKSLADEPPWRRYAAFSEPANGKPMIAIVIDDVGLNRGRIRDLVALPEIITLAFLPYANNLDESSTLTRQSGHEVMLHLPMEPLRASADPGPNALLQSLDLDEIRKRTVANLARFSGYVGVNNHMGSKFTAYEPGMAVVMDILKSKDLLFLDSRTTSASKGLKLASERQMLTGTRDVFIDNEIKVDAILKQLRQVEGIARKKGIAIAIGHPHAETIEVLKKWLPETAQKGFHFVPISAALVHQFNG